MNTDEHDTSKIENPDAHLRATEGARTRHVTHKHKKSPEAFPLGAQ